MPIRDEAINVFMGLPGDGPRLELTHNFGVDSYELGTGYNHVAVTVEDLDDTPGTTRRRGHPAGEAPYTVSENGPRICFVRDPDGYRIELIEGNVRPGAASSGPGARGPRRSALAQRIGAAAGSEASPLTARPWRTSK